MSQQENNPLNNMLSDAMKSANSAFDGISHILNNLSEEQRAAIMAEVGPTIQKAQKDIAKLNDQIKNIKI